jgi:hypothetical protein
MEKKLGKLERIELRDYWTDESRDFTPWLAEPENIALLGETLDIEMEVIEQEQAVGTYRADIYAKDTTNGTNILIENQLEKTDHSHLGQLITYAAGLDTLIVIWIAPEFTEEHRAAIDWLNRVTNENLNFFGIEIELWRIGNSLPAPKFNIVSKPNDWTRYIQQTFDPSQLSKGQHTLLEFWTEFKNFMESSDSKIKCRKPQPQNWMDFSLGKTGIWISTIANAQKGWIAIILWIGGTNRENRFNLLKNNYEKSSYEKISKDLIWSKKPQRKNDEVRLKLDSDPSDRSKWPEQNEWLRENLEKFYKFFYDKVNRLDQEESEGLPTQ